ncbi:MAG: O-antigen ligase family protein [Actinobacteria bacterium]|nr:O-antigen ligase family protein [Actinomycetota bacterium]
MRAATGALALVAVVIGLAIRPREGGLRRAPVLVGAALAAYALVSGLSLVWAASAERAFIEFDRALMYVSIFAAVVVLQRLGGAARWAAGLAAGIAAVCAVAFIGRCFPSLGWTHSLGTLLPAVRGRLSYPMGYWNGLGIFAGLGVTLLIACATSARHPVSRFVALAPIPLLAAVIYLTASRGAVAVVVAGCVALIALTARRVAVTAAFAVAAGGSAIVIAALSGRDALTNNPALPAASSQGHSTALIVLLACVVTGGLHALVSSSRIRDVHLPRPAAAAIAVLIAIVVLVGALASHPSRRIHAFKAPPAGGVVRNFTEQHFLSGGGSGRWQFWGAAWTEFRSEPLRGQGAGSFEAWWDRHGPIAYYVRDAHSLWLQTLGELGLLGFLPLLVAFAGGLAVGLGRLRARPPDERVAVAGVLATLIAWCVGAAIDWIWQLTAVGMIGVVCLALLCGRATAPASGTREVPRAAARGAAVAAVAAAAVVAIVLSGAMALPWLVEREIHASQAAVRSRNLGEAITRARAARSLQPWAASPYLQLALTNERGGALRAARRAIAGATRRDPSDWRLWLVYTRIATESGRPKLARRTLAAMRKLNPRSPLFAAGGSP